MLTQKELVKISNKTFRKISQFVCSKRYIFLTEVLRTSEIGVLKYMNLNLQIFSAAPELAWQAALKEAKLKLDLLTDIDMLSTVEKGIRGGIFHSLYQYAKANYKYMKGYDKNKESLDLQYCDVNDLYGWAMSQKLPLNNFEWIEDTSHFNEDYIKNYNEESYKGCFLEVEIQYTERLHELGNYVHYFGHKV